MTKKTDKSTCPECGNPIEDLRATCPNCGYEYKDKDYDDPEAGQEFTTGAMIDEEGNEITDRLVGEQEEEPGGRT
jgi:uncharacterized Zn finger protein (UPF0148 family)